MPDTNLKGVWHVARAFVKRCVAAGANGSIVNIASIGGLRQTKGNMPYSVSKIGVLQLTKCLALEWARHGMRVNALAPGFFKTTVNAALLATGEPHRQRYVSIIRIRDGRIVHYKDYWNPLAVIRGSQAVATLVEGEARHG